MKKRLVIFLLAVSLLLALPMGALADEVETETEETTLETEFDETLEATTEPPRAENQCGDDVFWTYSAGTLTISGTGAMDDLYENVPWDAYRDEITHLVLTGGVTYIGAHSFTDYDALVGIDFGDALEEIGYEAFRSCDGLTVIELPKSFKIFGEESFQSCSNLKEIHCNGAFPSFRQNCLWDTYANIIFPADAPWSVKYIAQLEEAFHGRIEFLASDGTDPYVPTEATEETTEETTAPTTEATTEATTEMTEMTTEATIETTVETVEQTQPESTAPETLPETTAPTEPDEEEKSGSIVVPIIAILCILIAVLFSMIGGTKKKKSKGGKYSRR